MDMKPQLLSAQDYYPFGSHMPGRSYTTNLYRFGFNGQEMDNEVFNNPSTSYTAEFWQYDSRIGRRWNVDPVVKPWESSYATFSDNPIWFSDPNGDNAGVPPQDYVDNGDGTATRTKDDGSTWSYRKDSDGNWVEDGGNMPQLSDVEVIAEKTQKSKNHVWSSMNMYSGNNLGKGVHMAKYGNGLDPWQEKVHQQFMAGIHGMSAGLNISLAVPAVVMAAPLYGQLGMPTLQSLTATNFTSFGSIGWGFGSGLVNTLTQAHSNSWDFSKVNIVSVGASVVFKSPITYGIVGSLGKYSYKGYEGIGSKRPLISIYSEAAISMATAAISGYAGTRIAPKGFTQNLGCGFGLGYHPSILENVGSINLPEK